MSNFGDISSALLAALVAGTTGYDFLSGKPGQVSVPVTSGTGFVWLETVEQNATDKNLEQIVGYISLYPIAQQLTDPLTPIDPTDLYNAVDSINAVILANQTTITGVWYVEVLSIEIDLDGQSVLATIQAWRDNAGAVGA